MFDGAILEKTHKYNQEENFILKNNKFIDNEGKKEFIETDNNIIENEFYNEVGKTNDKKSELIDVLKTNQIEDFSIAINIKEKLSDVKGINEIKDEILEIVKMLKQPHDYENAGAKLIKGILLIGKPGTGKTLLARALAGESNIKFIYCNGADFDKTFVGQGSNSIKKLFSFARENQPCIIFIDEIDSLLHKGRRSGMYSSSNDRGLINTFLSEMDGFNKRGHVFVLGATNSEKDLDKAAIRPGRFDKLITVPFPDSTGRKEIFDFYLSKVRF